MLNLDRLSEDVLSDLREMHRDDYLRIMTANEALNSWLEYQGVIGFTDDIINTYNELKGAEMDVTKGSRVRVKLVPAALKSCIKQGDKGVVVNIPDESSWYVVAVMFDESKSIHTLTNACIELDEQNEN